MRLVLELTRLGRPLMSRSTCRRRALAGARNRRRALSAELGCPGGRTVAVRHDATPACWRAAEPAGRRAAGGGDRGQRAGGALVADLQTEGAASWRWSRRRLAQFQRFHHRIDAGRDAPVWASRCSPSPLPDVRPSYRWAAVPMTRSRKRWPPRRMDDGSHGRGPVRSLLVDGVIAGAGSGSSSCRRS